MANQSSRLTTSSQISKRFAKASEGNNRSASLSAASAFKQIGVAGRVRSMLGILQGMQETGKHKWSLSAKKTAARLSAGCVRYLGSNIRSPDSDCVIVAQRTASARSEPFSRSCGMSVRFCFESWLLASDLLERGNTSFGPREEYPFSKRTANNNVLAVLQCQSTLYRTPALASSLFMLRRSLVASFQLGRAFPGHQRG